MTAMWVQSLHRLHCPTCDHLLLQRARRYFVSERSAHYYVGEVGTLRCPLAHALPDRDALYAYRAARGDGPGAPAVRVRRSR